MTIDESHLGSTRSLFGLQRHLLILSVETYLEVLHWELRSLRFVPPQSGFSESVVSSWQFCCTICCWEYEFLSFLWYQYFFRVGSSRIHFWCAHPFPILPNPPSKDLLSNSHRDQCIPKIKPTILHPDLIATVLQMSLPSFCALLSQQSHLFLICAVLTYNDSRINHHRLCQNQANCKCEWLWVSTSARETFLNSSPSPEKFSFCTDKIESIEWQDLEKRQRTGDQPVVKSPKLFCTRYCFASAPSAGRPCNCGSLAYFTISIFLEGHPRDFVRGRLLDLVLTCRSAF